MDEIDITDFYPKYPYIDDDNFFTEIFQLNEFYENKLDEKQENIKKGELFKQQKNVSRFLSGYTPYNGLLLFHEMGVGKTCAAVATAEYLIENKQSNIKNILVITKNNMLIDNFKKDIIDKCTYNKYIPKIDDNSYTTRILKGRLKKLIERPRGNYEFFTYDLFDKYLDKILTSRYLNENHDNSAIIIDEVHNIKEDVRSDLYRKLTIFLDKIVNKKVILLSGTPIRNKINEIADIFNLILPEHKRFNNFEKDYTTKENGILVMKEHKYIDFKNKIKGYSSFVSMRTSILKNFIDNSISNDITSEIGFKFENIYYNIMDRDSKQNKIYNQLINQISSDDSINTEDENDSFSKNLRNCSLGVFPDDSFGNDGFEQNLKFEDGKIKEIESKLTRYLESNGKDIDNKLEQLKNLSIKYYNIIKSIHENKNDEKIFIYSGSHVKQSGAMYLTKLLDIILGCKLTTNLPQSHGNRCILITSEQTDDTSIKLINLFNDVKNINGKIIKIIIGTQKISEGISLTNIKTIHVVEPWWNFSETNQAIARAIRATSHNDLLENNQQFKENPIVNIYLHCALSTNNENNEPLYNFSIDRKMYILSARKDKQIKKIERLIKESSFDCGLNYARNYNIKYGNQSRECDYEDCKYICDGLDKLSCEGEGENTNCEYKNDNTQINFNNFNIHYSDLVITQLEKLIKKDIQAIYTNMYNINNILEKYKKQNYSQFQIISAVKNIITSHQKIKNNFGITGFLNEFQNKFYMTSEIINHHDYSLDIYNKFPVIMENNNFQDFIRKETDNISIDDDKQDETLSSWEHFINLIFDNDIKYYLIKNKNGDILLRNKSNVGFNIGTKFLKDKDCFINGINMSSGRKKAQNIESWNKNATKEAYTSLCESDKCDQTLKMQEMKNTIKKILTDKNYIFIDLNQDDKSHDNYFKKFSDNFSTNIKNFFNNEDNYPLNNILRILTKQSSPSKACKYVNQKKKFDITNKEYDEKINEFINWLAIDNEFNKMIRLYFNKKSDNIKEYIKNIKNRQDSEEFEKIIIEYFFNIISKKQDFL